MKKNQSRTSKISILAHRGYRRLYGENTLFSANKAFEYDADGIEFDVQKCADEFVIIHDEIIISNEKTTDIAQSSFKKLSKLRSGKERIPQLTSFLENIPSGKIINAELKAETIRTSHFKEIEKQLRARRDEIIVSSFEHSLLPDYKKSGYKTGCLLEREHFQKGFLRLFISLLILRPYSINIPLEFFYLIKGINLKLIMFLFRSVSKNIIVWTVNNPEDFKLVSNYADMIITDDVETGMKFKNRYNNY
ncbi:MAG TPA: glycerophosphodiester phosphodiesterase family protein [Spirochaetota bacterium]|jgi:glycerophosphoryl diester phosphodiesterase|nr:glycerophosphodiester phosphodiesterase family protein [Spirochaetota bacterium]HOH37209.1 glycerophosphodiester phosphodiesterase family protein [Spirochaetota bacterium]